MCVRVCVVLRAQNVSDSWGPGLEDTSVNIIIRLVMESLSLFFCVLWTGVKLATIICHFFCIFPLLSWATPLQSPPKSLPFVTSILMQSCHLKPFSLSLHSPDAHTPLVCDLQSISKFVLPTSNDSSPILSLDISVK